MSGRLGMTGAAVGYGMVTKSDPTRPFGSHGGVLMPTPSRHEVIANRGALQPSKNTGLALVIGGRKPKGVPRAPMTSPRVLGAWAAHGIRKSYIPGRGWIPANRVSRRELTALARGGRAMAARKAKAAAQEESGRMHRSAHQTAEFAQRHGSLLSTKGQIRPNSISYESMSEEGLNGLGAFAMKTGGRRAPGRVWAGPRANAKVIQHEHAHITPKRSGYRLSQIQRDPVKAMREEGRADFTAGIRYTRKVNPLVGEEQKMGSAYARAARNDRFREHMQVNPFGQGRRSQMYSPEAVQGYRDVQRKMQLAQVQRNRSLKVQRALQQRGGN